MDTLATRLRSRRRELGLTLLDIAEAIGVSKPTVQRYESGVIRRLSQERLEALAMILKTTPAFLLGWGSNPAQAAKPAESASLRDMLAALGIIDAGDDISDERARALTEALRALIKASREQD